MFDMPNAAVSQLEEISASLLFQASFPLKMYEKLVFLAKGMSSLQILAVNLQSSMILNDIYCIPLWMFDKSKVSFLDRS